MAILFQFLMRLAFGLAVGMAITSPRQVASGFYRNHLWVTLGLTVLAAMVAFSHGLVWWPACLAAVASYLGAISWLYEKAGPGLLLLWVVAALALVGAGMAPFASNVTPPPQDSRQGELPTSRAAAEAVEAPFAAQAAATFASGLVLGLTLAAMLLGHWYLNAPGMQLAPLRRLLVAIAAAVVLQALICGAGLAGELGRQVSHETFWWLLVGLRWSFGLVGVLGLVAMAWQTLQIPNTQSATGILYVAVIGAFTGELTGLLLSARSVFPL